MVYVDKNGYLKDENNNLVHRQIAYKYIYQKNRQKYPLRFSEYQVHHIDNNKLNNDISKIQLQICWLLIVKEGI